MQSTTRLTTPKLMAVPRYSGGPHHVRGVLTLLSPPLTSILARPDQLYQSVTSRNPQIGSHVKTLKSDKLLQAQQRTIHKRRLTAFIHYQSGIQVFVTE